MVDMLTDLSNANPTSGQMATFLQNGDASAASVRFTAPSGINQTVATKLGVVINPQDYGPAGGAADSAPALQAAINVVEAAGGGIVLCPSGTYCLATTVVVKPNVRLDLQGSVVTITTGATIQQLLTMSGRGAQVVNGRFIGAGMTGPTGLYGSGPSNGTAIYITGSHLAGLRIDNLEFEDFPAGAVLVGGAAGAAGFVTDLLISRCRARNMQSYVANETPAVFHLHGSDASKMVDCTIDGYGWKGFYIGNSFASAIIGCHASGGNTSNSSHHIVGDAAGLYSDNAIVDCSHAGPGFGFKLDRSWRPAVRNFSQLGGAGAGQIQGCADFLVDGVMAGNQDDAPIYVDGLSGMVTRGSILNVKSKRASVGTTGNHVGVKINAVAGGPVDALQIRGCRFENVFYGVIASNSGYQKTRIDIIDNEFVGVANYGLILFIGSGRLNQNRITMSAGNNAPIFVAQDGVTTAGRVEIVGNETSGANTDHIQIGEGFRINYASISIRDNLASGGARFLDYKGDQAAPNDVILRLDILNNVGQSMTANGLNLTFNATTSTILHADGNDFRNASSSLLPDVITNPGSVEITGHFTYAGDPNAVFKAAVGSRYSNTSGGVNTSYFVKESGPSVATGWAAI